MLLASSHRPVVPRHKRAVESATRASAEKRQGRRISFLLIFVVLIFLGLLISIVYKRRVLQRVLWPQLVGLLRGMGGEDGSGWKSITSSLVPFVTRQARPVPMWSGTPPAPVFAATGVERSAQALGSMSGSTIHQVPMRETEPYTADPVTDSLPAISS